jgi:hypothetical protein
MYRGQLAIPAACHYTIWEALGQRPARGYFKLRCPNCGHYTSSAADFFFNRAKRKDCGAVW